MGNAGKRTAKKIIAALLSVVLLLAAAYIIARFAFGYDILDRSGWHIDEDGSKCYLDYHGNAIVGWQTVDGMTYYFDPMAEGDMHSGWLQLENDIYYLDNYGQKTTGFVNLENDCYYFDENGCMQIGWQQIGDVHRYFDTDGKMHMGWLDLPEGRFYLDRNGQMQTGWLELPEGRFCLDVDGKMLVGWVETEQGLCYLSESGAVSPGWTDTDRGRVYVDVDGFVRTGWIETEQGRFYIEPDGTVRTGWFTEGEKTYYLGENGQMHCGWLQLDGERYYFREDGTMAIGKVEIDGVNSYFTSKGKYFVMVNPWNTVPDDYETELVWFDGFQVSATCYDALLKMRDGCLAAGVPFGLTSAYRSIDYQTTLFQNKVNRLMAQGYSREAAERETGLSIAIPGTSEHQLGLAVDVKSGQNTYDWLAQHSWEYGFIMRYPIGATELTGIYYEPWHFRYVGDELAKELFDLGICVEAYVNMLTEKAAAIQ